MLLKFLLLIALYLASLKVRQKLKRQLIETTLSTHPQIPLFPLPVPQKFTVEIKKDEEIVAVALAKQRLFALWKNSQGFLGWERINDLNESIAPSPTRKRLISNTDLLSLMPLEYTYRQLVKSEITL